MRALGLWLSVFLTACGGNFTQYERDGDKALAGGDRTKAAELYSKALEKRPIMDFDYERVRDKRLAAVGAEWKPKINSAIEGGRRDAVAKLETLLETRRGAREAGAAAADLRQIERAVLDASNAERLAGNTVDQVLALLEKSFVTRAPQQTVDAALAALRTGLAKPYAPAAGQGFAELVRLIDLRKRIRTMNLPRDVDRALDPMFLALATATVTPPAAENARTMFDVASETARLLAGYEVPAAAWVVVGRAQDAAIEPLIANAKQLATAHKYLEAQATLVSLQQRSIGSYPIGARLDEITTEGADWHAARAQQLPAGYRRYLELAIAATLMPTSSAAAEEALAGLERITPLGFEVRVDAPASCADVARAVRGTTAPRMVPVRVSLACSIAELRRTETGTSAAFEVQVSGTRQVTRKKSIRDPGTHFEDCTAYDSFGTPYSAKCEKPNTGYITIDEVVDEAYTETVKQTKDYPIDVREPTADASGTASLTWDDGAVVSVPVKGHASMTSRAFDYDTPSATLGGSAQHFTQAHTATTLAVQASVAGGQISAALPSALVEAIATHRGNRARADGVAATSRRDDAAAAEAFIKSVLVEGAVKNEAIAWFERTHGLSAEVASAVVLSRRITRPDLPAAPAIAAYSGGEEPKVTSEVIDTSRELDVSTMNEKSQHSGIKSGIDIGYFFIGAAPYRVKTATGSVTSISMGLQFGMSPLSPLTRYGPAIQDDGGLRLSWGMRFGTHEYANGDEEGQIAWAFEANYRLMAGLRTHTAGLFAGVGAGWMRVSTGDTLAKGSHLEPTARLSLRAVGVQTVLIDVSGFVYRFGDHARRDRVSLMIPVSTKHQFVALGASYESTDVRTTSLDEDGETTMDLGRQPAQSYMVQVGASF